MSTSTSTDLAQSVAFYSKLFGAEPARVEADYAKWMLDDPRVNFAISTRGGKPGVDHLGIQTDSADELAQLKAARRDADMALLDEGAASCCYARSDKYWLTDPQGIAWEQFHTLGDIPVFSEAAGRAGQRVPAARASRRRRRPRRQRPRPAAEAGRWRMTTNVLFLCTHNSARSVLARGHAQPLGARLGCDVRAYSAGSAPERPRQPAGARGAARRRHRHRRAAQQELGRVRRRRRAADAHRHHRLRQRGRRAARFWPGSPVKVHWGYADPSSAAGGDDASAAAFELTRQAIGYRMLQLLRAAAAGDGRRRAAARTARDRPELT